jgi:hypothetical protein
MRYNAYRMGMLNIGQQISSVHQNPTENRLNLLGGISKCIPEALNSVAVLRDTRDAKSPTRSDFSFITGFSSLGNSVASYGHHLVCVETLDSPNGIFPLYLSPDILIRFLFA